MIKVFFLFFFLGGACMGHFYGTHSEKNGPTAPHHYSASFSNSYFSISLWERPKTLHLHDFGIFGHVHDSQNQSYFLWRHQISQNNSRTDSKSSPNTIIVGNLELLDIVKNEDVGKDGRQKIMKIRLDISWKSWI